MKPIYPDPRLYRTGDYIHCDGGPDPFSAVTRIVSGPKEEPWWKRFRNHDICTHTGVVATFAGQRFVVEMRPNGCENNAPEFYRVPFGQKPRIIMAVTRPRLLTASIRSVLDERMALDVRRGIEYALKDLPRFVWERIKADKRRMYCTEYAYLLSRGRDQQGNMIPGLIDLVPDAPKKFDDLVAPNWFMNYTFCSEYHEIIWTRPL